MLYNYFVVATSANNGKRRGQQRTSLRSWRFSEHNWVAKIEVDAKVEAMRREIDERYDLRSQWVPSLERNPDPSRVHEISRDDERRNARDARMSRVADLTFHIALF
jgi:hypothetical protein